MTMIRVVGKGIYLGTKRTGVTRVVMLAFSRGSENRNSGIRETEVSPLLERKEGSAVDSCAIVNEKK